MSNKLIFIYDDRVTVPNEVKEIVSVDNFSEIYKSNHKIHEIIFNKAHIEHFTKVFHIKNDNDLEYIETLISEESNLLYLVFPSSFAPNNENSMVKLIKKCKYSSGIANFYQRHTTKTINLLTSREIKDFIRLKDEPDYETFFSNLQFESNIEIDQNNFSNLSNLNSFIEFMWNSTSTRSFNTISVNLDCVKKKSNDETKMFAEYNFYQLLDGKMKQFIVPTFNYTRKNDISSYEMERLYIPDVSIQYINKSLTPLSFKKLCNLFFEYINSRKIIKVSKKEYIKSYEEKIIEKMNSRISEFIKTELGVKIDQQFNQNYSINIVDLALQSEKLIRKILSRDNLKLLAISHGDTCFSNILYDKRINLFRLIDPKGAINEADLYLNPLYDVAKFSHSILGDYDLINHNLFECSFDDDLNMVLLKHQVPSSEIYKKEFIDQLNENNFNLLTIRAVELSLFISMLPFHADQPKKVLGYLINAKNLLNSLDYEINK